MILEGKHIKEKRATIPFSTVSIVVYTFDMVDFVRTTKCSLYLVSLKKRLDVVNSPKKEVIGRDRPIIPWAT